MYIGQVVKARQLIVRPDGTTEQADKRARKYKKVQGKIVYITKYGLIGVNLGKYIESFRSEEIMEV